MSTNYYETLEISRSANSEEIANAYRRLALKFHPNRNSHKDFEINNYYFHRVCEAFLVLSDRNH